MEKEALQTIEKLYDMVNSRKAAEDFARTLKMALQLLERMKQDVDAKLEAVKDGTPGRDGRDGKDGKSIQGPKGEKGEKGDRGEPGQSIVGPAGKDGKDGSPDMAEDIRNKLELLEGDERLSIEAIRDLREELDKLDKRIKSTGGTVIAHARGAVKAYDLSSQLDGSTKTFNMPTMWRVISVHLSSTPNVLRPTVDYTWTPNTVTFTDQIDAPSSLEAGQTCIIVYAEP